MKQLGIAALATLLVAPVLLSCSAMPHQNSYTATDKTIHWSGRHHKVQHAVEYDWPGVSFAFRTDAPEVRVNLDGGNSDYNIWVDNALQQVWRGAPDERSLTLQLGVGTHRVAIEKRNDGHYGKALVSGVTLPKGGKLYPVTEQPTRRIEFIGDSYTVGYGAEGPGVACDSLREYENVHHSFAALTARALNAEAHYVAMSGKGVARNYGDDQKISALNLVDLYPRALASRDDVLWDTRQWQPDTVVIKLGNNDFSTEPHPDTAVFVSRLHGLIARVQKQYGDIPIVLFADTGLAAVVEHVTQAFETASPSIKDQLHLVVAKIPEGEAKLPYLGCDWHPNIEGHKLLAEPLIEKLSRVLGE